MESRCFSFVFFLFVTTLTQKALSKITFFRGIAGDINDKYLSKDSGTKGLDCLWKKCAEHYCFASYNPWLGTCRRSTIMGEAHYWFEGKYNITYKPPFDPSSPLRSRWRVYVSLSREMQRPQALWMFTTASRGANWGSKRNLDCPVKYLDFTGVEGPKYFVKDKLARGGLYPERISNGPSSNPTLNFQGPFSIAAWVKTDKYQDQMPIVDSSPRGAVDFWFWKSKERDQLHLGINYATEHYYMTKINREFQASAWRHVAVTYDPRSRKAEFYMSGNKWPSSVNRRARKNGNDKAINPRELCLWGTCDVFDDYFFRGSLTCLAIYERAMTQKEVKKNIFMCP